MIAGILNIQLLSLDVKIMKCKLCKFILINLFLVENKEVHYIFLKTFIILK